MELLPSRVGLTGMGVGEELNFPEHPGRSKVEGMDLEPSGRNWLQKSEPSMAFVPRNVHTQKRGTEDR